MSRPIERVVIVGRDAAAWVPAFALKRAFGRTGLDVHVLELGWTAHPVDVFAALPTISGMHDLLGLDEDQILAATAGVPVFAQRFANWSRAQQPFMHAYDTQGAPLGSVEFLQLWLRARAEGMNVALEDFSLGAAAAKQGRYVVNSEESAKFSRAAPGYHFSALHYAHAMRTCALKIGVTAQGARIADFKREGERITSIVLTDGAEVEADLFIDASGQEAALIGAAQNSAFEPWHDWLACDRIITGSGRRLSPLPAFAQISAFKAGWVGAYPLQDRTAIVAAFDGAHIEDRDMLQHMSVISGVALEGEAVTSEIKPGMRRNAWIGNCVAIGDAAICLEPLDAAPLHVLQTTISHLISLFPVAAESMPEAALYNEGVAQHGENLRDFQIAHYKLNQRIDEPFWDRARAMRVPETLAYKLHMFANRGRVPLYDNETFQEPSWNSILIGHGATPGAYDPVADATPSDALIQTFKSMLRFIAEEVQDMPSVEAHLEMRMPAAATEG